jgi:hypothetical protein
MRGLRGARDANVTVEFKHRVGLATEVVHPGTVVGELVAVTFQDVEGTGEGAVYGELEDVELP